MEGAQVNARAIEHALTGIAMLVFLGAIAFIAAALTHCKPADNPRAQARSVVLTIAEGVAVGDVACASIARAKLDLELARECAFARDEAREALIIAEDALDASDAAAAEKVPCAVSAALASANRLVGLIERAGGRVPPALADGLQLAPLLAGGCRG